MDIISRIINSAALILRFFQEYIFYFYVFGFICSFIFLILIMYYLTKTHYIRNQIYDVVDAVQAKHILRRRILRAWKTIKERLRSEDSAQCKLALIEADRMLNDVFVMAGLEGGNLDERLARMDSSQLSNYQEVVAVHAMAMRAFSDPSFSLTPGEADAAILIYKRAFQELGLVREV